MGGMERGDGGRPVMTATERKQRDRAVFERASWAFCSAQVTVRRDSTYYSKYVPVLRREGCTDKGETISTQDSIGCTFPDKDAAIASAIPYLDAFVEGLKADPHFSDVRRNTRQTVTYRWDRSA